MTFNPRIFREYDIRGQAERDLPNDFVATLGLALGTFWARHGITKVAVGRDCRLHSPRLFAELTTGIRRCGVSVIDVGVVATPLLYYAVRHFGLEGGVQITGSHNPPEDNGFKILRGKTTIHGGEIQELRHLCESRNFAITDGEPAALEQLDIVEPYLAMAQQRIELGPRRFKIVVDAGNGVGGPLVPLLERLGFETIGLFIEPDGEFPNHHPDPTVEENVAALHAAVKEHDAELGIALDGDADRIGVVDNRGRVVWGDQLMILLARAILTEQPGAVFVSEVKCSKALYDEIARAGGQAIMWKVGHSLIKEKMRESGAVLAGEMSGHIFFAHRYFGYDDAIYSGARLVELLSKSDRTLAEHVDTLPHFFNTPEIRYAVEDEKKFELVRRVVAHYKTSAGPGKHEVVDVDGARVTWSDAWALVRASNTQPVLVMRFEATSAERLAAVRAEVERDLKQLESGL